MTENVQARVKRWLKEIIIDHHFCPFAKDPFAKGQIFFYVSDKSTQQQLFQDWLEMLLLFEKDLHAETALFIVPALDSDFELYLDIEQIFSIFLEEEYDQYTLAPFHPKFIFDEKEQDEPENWIHRAPHAIFHLLKTSTLSQIVDDNVDIPRILERNKKHAASLGHAFFRQYLN